MGFRQSVECPRCGTTTIYTNEVERALWGDRRGCPACFNPRQDEGVEDDAPEIEREAPIGFEPRVAVNGIEVRVLSWEVVTDGDGNDTGRRLIGIELP